MGLGQWFIREYAHNNGKKELAAGFLKFQLLFGALFYFVNVLLAFLLYSDKEIYIISIIFGLNVIFDNIIYGIKHLNIAEFKQKKTFLILIIDAFLRMLAASLLFLYPMSVIVLCIVLVSIRFITVNLFLKVGSSNSITARSLFQNRIRYSEVRKLVVENWRFVVIGSVSVLFWRVASIIVSKLLGDILLANYEISFKIFSLAQVIPLTTSASVYPVLIKKYQEGGVAGLRSVYRLFFIAYAIFGLTCFTFIHSFSDGFIPFLFGHQYPENPIYTRQMFLSMLVFPTALLQANIIVAMRHERVDMIYNIITALINVIGSIAGAYVFKTLAPVNYSIFVAFLVFHVLQDIFLVRYKVSSVAEVSIAYGVGALLVIAYIWLNSRLNAVVLFGGFWMLLCVGLLFYFKKKKLLLAN
jgi:O-antigen/teichoic acid export membrane protein